MPSPDQSGEIALIDLLSDLGKRWKLIVLTGLIGLAIAFSLVVGKEEKYKISVPVSPPNSADIQSLLIASSLSQQPVAWTGSTSPWTPYIAPPKRINPSEVYHVFEYALVSNVVLSRYLENYQNVPRFEFTKSGRTITIFAYSPDADSTLDRIHGYIEYASKHTINKLATELADDIEQRIIIGKHAENSLVKIFRQQQNDRIAILREAHDAARNVGATKPLETVNHFSANKPLYLRGTESLEAEIHMLEKRTDSDAYFFIPQIREIQEWIRMLGEIKIDPATMSVAQSGLPEISQISTSFVRTLMLGLVGGVLLGVGIIFFSILLKQQVKP